MRKLSVAEQRYQAVLAVSSDGLSISQGASKVGMSRQTLHAWLARYEAQGLEGLVVVRLFTGQQFSGIGHGIAVRWRSSGWSSCRLLGGRCCGSALFRCRG